MVFKLRINKHKFVVVNTFNYPRKSEINEFTLYRIITIYKLRESYAGIKNCHTSIYIKGGFLSL